MSSSGRLDGLCHPVSKFWGQAVVQNQTDFSPCFEDTALLFVPCIFLFLVAALQFCFDGYVHRPIPVSRLHVAKSLFTVLVTATAVADLAKSVYDSVKHRLDSVAPYELLSPSVLLLATLLAMVLLQRHRLSGVRSSGTLFIFWLLMTVYGSIKLRTYILIEKAEIKPSGSHFRFATTILFWSWYVCLLVLNCFKDKKPLYTPVDDDQNPCPENDASFLSVISFWWLNSMVVTGFKRPLTRDDLWSLMPDDKSSYVVPRFLSEWKKETSKADRKNTARDQLYDMAVPSLNESISSDENILIPPALPAYSAIKPAKPYLIVALFKAFGRLFFVAGLFKLCQDIIIFISPQLLKLMINFTENKTVPVWRGYVYAVLLFIVAEIQSVFLHQYFIRQNKLGMRLRTAVISAVYRKAMKLSSSARKKSTTGEIVNLMAIDAQRFSDLMLYAHMIWSAPLQILLAAFFLWQTMGPSVLAGIGVMILLIPINGAIAVVTRKLQVQQMVLKDQRIKVMNEVLSGIKVIKLYAWERSFLESVSGVRREELKVLRKIAYLNAVSSFSWACAPFMVSLATFATYALTGHPLTPDKAFVALSLFNILRFPLTMLPMLVSFMVEAYVSMKRVTKFLLMDELDPGAVKREERPPIGENEDVLTVEQGSFTWEKNDRLILQGINLHIRNNCLMAIVGQVGAGKSSLLSALLGEMEKESGQTIIRGSVAYAGQQAWIQNATVKDNILFGKPLDQQRYNKAVQACALGPDLEILPGGDMTEIGEKGINLSGGQKQRVSLARAVYNNADVYFLDDPLSAVDAHVGKHIFEQVIGPEGVLKNKVRLFVTHGLSFLPQCDQVIVLSNGRISEMGTYDQLLQNNGAFAEFLRTYTEHEDKNGEDDEDYDEDEDLPEDSSLADMWAEGIATPVSQQTSRQDGSPTKSVQRQLSKRASSRKLLKQKSIIAEEIKKQEEEKAKLIDEEKAETGMVKLSVFAQYFKAIGIWITMVIIFFLMINQGLSIGSSIWLSVWSDDEQKHETHNSSLHDLSYYLGVYAALGLGQGVMVMFGSFVMAVGAIKAARLLHKHLLTNILRSPMSFFDTTPLGRIINRFSKDVYFIDETIPRSLRMFLSMTFSVLSTVVVISYSTPIFLAVVLPLTIVYVLTQRFFIATSRQLRRLEAISRSPIYSHFQESLNGTTTIRAYGQAERFIADSDQKVDINQTAYYPNVASNRWLAIRLEFVGNSVVLFAALFAVIERNHITSGLVGLSISYALQITQSLNWMVRMTSDLETNIVSVERVKEYSETPVEAPAIVNHYRPDPGWPFAGQVNFNSYSVRYRQGLDLVLRNINCAIAGGEKIGIVGRTGAGKSSLTLSVFRIIEAAGGNITIDNIDISSIGLEDLRSRITIIPQDPVLFSGTLRVNLDPFNIFSDEDVWHALESAHLKTYVESLESGLQHEVSEGGENLSVGQRQLVCLARALLRKTKILVLDEATAAIDLETDDLIQQTIRREFADCTILTIAHRLNTIMDSDRVMVLDKGNIVEFDSPANLLARRGIFYSMAQDAGLV